MVNTVKAPELALPLCFVACEHTYHAQSACVPARTQRLQEQASWNLCPVPDSDIMFSRECYFGDDDTFDQLSGARTVTLSDVPPGMWSLVMRRDTFHKTSGAILDFTKVLAISYYYRVYIGAVAAAAQQEAELKLLETGKQLASTPFMEYARGRLGSDQAFRDYVTATCACSGVRVEDGRTFTYSDPLPGLGDTTPFILLPFQRSFDPVSSLQELQTKVGDRTGQMVVQPDQCACLCKHHLQGAEELTGAWRRCCDACLCESCTH